MSDETPSKIEDRAGFAGKEMSPDDPTLDITFFPILSPDNSNQIIPGMFLGSTEGTVPEHVSLDKTTHILTVAHNGLPEKLPGVEYKQIDILDCPTEMIIKHFQECFEFIGGCMRGGGNVFVHCGRGISRSSTIVMAYLMQTRNMDVSGAFALVSENRPCVYPNIGFQLQLHLFEKTRKIEFKTFNLEAEIVIWIKQKLRDVKGLISAIFEDEQLLEDCEPWRYLGFFFENCRQYLGRIDIPIPKKILVEADDTGRQLANIAMLFEGEGVELASKVGQVMQGWVKAQQRLSGTGIGRHGVIADGQALTDLKEQYDSLLWRTAPKTFKDGNVLSEDEDEGDEPAAKKAKTA